MDVLVEKTDDFPVNWQQMVADEFKPNDMYRNSDVLSFDVEQLQVDLLLTPTDEYETSRNYFSWNDTSNFVGRVSHKLGFKYGHRGLEFVFRDGNYQHAVLNVTRDTRAALEFLGFDADRYFEGFDTMEDAFKWASNTHYFNKAMFAVENRNHRSNVRDKKRKNYSDFVTWMQDKDLPEYPWEDMKEQGGPKYKEQFMQLAFVAFPDFLDRYSAMITDYNNLLEFRKRFNGSLVSEWTGKVEKELGMVMQSFRKSFNDPSEMVPWVLASTDEEVKLRVMNLLE